MAFGGSSEVRFQEELYTAEPLTGRALHARQAESPERR